MVSFVSQRVQRFSLDGFYRYSLTPKGKGELTGEIALAANGSFQGRVYDSESVTPRQIIRGHFGKQEGVDRLVFLKFPLKEDLANLAYVLQKDSNGLVEGRYVGQWGALPLKVSFKEDYGLFIAQIDMSVCGVGDSAEINLRKR